MSNVVLNVEARARTGSGGARADRRAGLVPGIVYGGGKDPAQIVLSANELRKAILRGGLKSSVIELVEKNGAKQTALIKEIQFHPVTDVPVHLDFYRVKEGQVIAVEVPVHFLNQEASPGLKRGGALNIVRHTIELECPANAIPAAIEVDLTGLEIGDSVHISALKLPRGVEPAIKDRDFTIATIAGAGAEEPEEAAAPETETEVIKKGKAEEGEG